ncbi:nucleotide-diphospho-sugar transferase [Dichotomocladium elegans]|nr:nucleotide-diphospho-sugar transferase [Dichotomocladium elegans]
MEAYLTLVSTDSYAPGAMVLARRLIDLHTSKSLACLVTPNVSDRVRQLLQECQYNVIQVDPIYTTRPDNLVLLGRPDLAATLTKINLWRLKQYKKVVFLDADTFPLRSIDELFDRPSFAAAPDIGWPDCFNSGVFVAEPSEQIFNALVHMAAEKGSFDGGDQGLLNSYFHNWPETNEHRLPFLYNTTPSAAYSYVPAFLEFKHKIAVVHFIGKDKPWNAQRFADGSIFHPRGPAVELVQQWWDTWDKFYGKDVLPANLMAPMVPAGKDTPPSLPDDLSYSYQAAAPSKWLEFATPDSTTNWDMKELQKDVDRITARMHILKHNGQRRQKHLYHTRSGNVCHLSKNFK